MSDEAAPAPDLGMLANPQPMYKMMRDLSPVVTLERGHGISTVVVAKHEDVLTVLRNPDIFSSGDDAVHIGQIRPLIPLQIDPPDHSKYRKLLDPLFAPKRIAQLEQRTRELVNSMIDGIESSGGANYHLTIAEPLPSTVFLELLGLPVSRAKEFIALKDGIIRPPVTNEEDRIKSVNATGAKIYAILEEIVEERSRERRNDFVSGFLDSEVDGERLTKNDVVDICYLFFLAGLDTVTASLDCFMAYLARNPEQRKSLVDDPSLIPAAIEEMMRWETPVTGVARITTQDTELSGCPIKKGTGVSPLLASANTDEAFWADADKVDFHRESNKHLSFGGGVHRCLGSHLARMELRVALEEWHRRIPEYRLKDGIELVYSQGLRQVENLELVW
jgi:cytochrome P450